MTDSPGAERLGPTGWIAAALALALVLLAGARAATLGGEVYDAYEVRTEARRLLDGSSRGRPPTYRSPLLVTAAAAAEVAGLGWVGPALLAAASYALLVALGAWLARRVGARPDLAALSAALLASCHPAFVYAGHGMSDLPAAAAGAGVLVLALGESVDGRRAAATGAVLGLAALIRPQAGLLGLALLGAFPRPWSLARLATAAAVALAVYGALSTLFFAAALGSLTRGLAAHGEVLAFMREQLAENAARYGPAAPFGANPLGLLRAAPALTLLAVAGAALGGRRGAARGPALVLTAWAGVHLAVLATLAQHFEARYLLPATPALAGLAGLTLEAAARGAQARRGRAGALAVAAAGLVALGLQVAWAAPHEARRLRDPLVRRSFPARIADAARRAAGPGARFVWTTAHTFPVVPAVVHAEDAYPGDPWYGLLHLGPTVIGYHLGQAVIFPRLVGPDGRPLPGLTRPDELRALVRAARLPDGSAFRAGDVLLVGISELSPTWRVRARPRPPFGIAPVTSRAGALDVEVTWIPQDEQP